MSGQAQEIADILVIGSGVAGLSTALQLAARGQRVILLEKGELASGSTQQASGLLGQLRSNQAAVRMLMDSMAILEELQERAGRQILTRSGSVRLAQEPARAAEIRRGMEVARTAGLPVYEIDAGEVARRLPYMETGDILAACFCPTDGYLSPPELARLYIRIARQNGVDLRPYTPVERIVIESGRVAGCRAGGKEFSAPVVVNAAGPWSYLVAELAEQRLPTAAIGHCYLVVGPHADHPVDPNSPSVRDRKNLIYSRPTREGALHVGIYETEPVVYEMEALSPDFRMREMRTPMDHPTVQALLAGAQRRFPFVTAAKPVRVTTGIMAWTPDGSALCGQIPGVAGLYHCAGFCGHGVMQSPAIGRLMAELILDGTCRYNMADLEADRFFDLPEFADRHRVEARCAEAYASCYSRIESAEAMRGS